VNIGSGEEVSILSLAERVAEAVGFEGSIVMDPSKPDGTPRKLLDSGKIRAMGWRPRVSLRDGLKRAYLDFLSGNGRR
jgi:GDP-L-fucose synthase